MAALKNKRWYRRKRYDTRRNQRRQSGSGELQVRTKNPELTSALLEKLKNATIIIDFSPETRRKLRELRIDIRRDKQ